MDRFDICIAGGVVGLAIAHRLLEAAESLDRLTEQESSFGQHTSSRLSEVIHAGIYYPLAASKPGYALKGKRLCILSATIPSALSPNRQVDRVEFGLRPSNHELAHNAKSNGVDDLEYWAEDRIKVAEPAVRAAHGLTAQYRHLDSHQYMQTLITLNQQQGMSCAAHHNHLVTLLSRGFGKNKTDNR